MHRGHPYILVAHALVTDPLRAVTASRMEASQAKLEKWANKQLQEDMDDWKERVSDRVNSLFQIVKEIKPKCRSMYIGRTNCPERRLMEHCKKESETDYHMILLHWTPDWSEVMAMEECLIELSTKYGKLKNEIGDSLGNIYGNWQCLYLRVQWKPFWKEASRSGYAYPEAVTKTMEIGSLSPDTLSLPFPPLQQLTCQQLTCTQLRLKKTTDVEEHLAHDRQRKRKLT